MFRVKRLCVLAGLLGVLLFTAGAQAAPGDVFYSDDFESYAVDTTPATWSNLTLQSTDIVTAEWAAGGAQSLVTISEPGEVLGRPFVDLSSLGGLPDFFSYEATLRMEPTASSSGLVGFLFVDPRTAAEVAAANAVVFGLDGKVIWAGPGLDEIALWTPGTDTVVTVKVEIDFLTNTADIWLDGVQAGDGLAAFPRVIPADGGFGSEVTLDKWGFGLAGAVGDANGRVLVDSVTLGEFAGTLTAEVKVRPRTLNLRSKGKFITVIVELPEGYDAHDIDVSSVYLYSGDATAIFALAKPTAVRDGDGDGLFELMVKFVRADVQAMLEPGDAVEIFVGGALTDGVTFLGSDSIKAKNPGRKKQQGAGTEGDNNGDNGNGGGKGNKGGKK